MFYVYEKREFANVLKESMVITPEMIDKLNLLPKKKVYSVQYKNGYPFFTFYENGQWITKSAKHYMPIED